MRLLSSLVVIDGLALGVEEEPRFAVNVGPQDGITEVGASHERLGSNLGYFWFYTPDTAGFPCQIPSS